MCTRNNKNTHSYICNAVAYDNHSLKSANNHNSSSDNERATKRRLTKTQRENKSGHTIKEQEMDSMFTKPE